MRVKAKNGFSVIIFKSHLMVKFCSLIAHSNAFPVITAISVAVFLVEKVGRLLNLEYGKDTTAGLICKMMVENLAMSSQAKDVFCIWLVSPLLRKSGFTI